MSISGACRNVVAGQVAGGLALFASFWFPPLAMIGLVPVALFAASPRHGIRAYLAPWLGGLAFFLPGVQWLRYCDDSAWLGWLLLAFYLSLYFPAFVLLARTTMLALRMPLAWTVPVVWVALEYVRMHALTGFGWLMLAHSVHGWTLWLQTADLGGVYAVSFIVALVNGMLAQLLQQNTATPEDQSDAVQSRGFRNWLRARSLTSRTQGLASGAACVLAALIYGGYRLQTAAFANGPTAILIQTNLPQRLKLDNTDETYKAVESVSNRANNVPGDLVVWPETSFPYMFGDYPANLADDELFARYKRRHGPPTGRMKDATARTFAAFIREAIDAGERNLAEVCDLLQKPLLVSVLRYEFRSAESTFHNSAVLFAPGKGRVGCYDKLHLVPFGEYVPMKDTLPILRVLLPYDSDNMGVDAGARYTILKHGAFELAPTICFEDTLPHIGRGFMNARTGNDRVDFFVSQCNDGWFQGSVEGDLHLAASVFRCVECRRAMIRSANMCVTAAIDPNGRIFARLPKHAEDYLKVVVPLDRRETIYVQLGDWLPMICVAIAAGAIFRLALRQCAIARRGAP